MQGLFAITVTIVDWFEGRATDDDAECNARAANVDSVGSQS